MKVQLRNPLSLRCRRRSSSGRQHPGTTAIAKGGPGSPESLAQGMLLRGFPMKLGELAISCVWRIVTRADFTANRLAKVS